MDPLQAFMQSNALVPPAFSPSSRYYGLPTAQFTFEDGRTVVFVTRRFLPPTENFAVIQTVIVAAEDRLDILAARHFGDPELSWRICDANGAMQPEGLVAQVGAALEITMPEGVPGAVDAR